MPSTSAPPVYLIVRPGEFVFYEDYIHALQWAFAELGVPFRVIESNGPLGEHSAHILYLYTGWLHIQSPLKNIFRINTEQCSRASVMDDLIGRSNVPFFDYDQFQSQSLGFHYLPYVINPPETARLSAPSPKRYDVAMVPVNTPRRQRVFDLLKSRGANIIEIRGFGAPRDGLISQTKILLNVHANDEYRIFEHYRVDRVVMAGNVVVSERSWSDDLLDMRDMLIFSDFENIADTVANTLQQYDGIKEKLESRVRACYDSIVSTRSEHVITAYTFMLARAGLTSTPPTGRTPHAS